MVLNSCVVFALVLKIKVFDSTQFLVLFLVLLTQNKLDLSFILQMFNV